MLFRSASGITSDSYEYSCLVEFAQAIGLAFQIQDDILDADEPEHKTTYISLLGLECTKQHAKDCQQQAVTAAAKLKHGNDLLIALANFIITRNC